MREKRHHELLNARNNVFAQPQCFHARTCVVQRREFLFIAVGSALENIETAVKYRSLIPQSNPQNVRIVCCRSDLVDTRQSFDEMAGIVKDSSLGIPARDQIASFSLQKGNRSACPNFLHRVHEGTKKPLRCIGTHARSLLV